MHQFNEHKFYSLLNSIKGILMIVCTVGLLYSGIGNPPEATAATDKSLILLARWLVVFLFLLGGIFFFYRAGKNWKKGIEFEKAIRQQRVNLSQGPVSLAYEEISEENKKYSSLARQEKAKESGWSNRQLISIILLVPVVCLFAVVVYLTMNGSINHLFNKKHSPPQQETKYASKPDINIEIPQFDRYTIYNFWKTKWGMDKDDIRQLMGGTRLEEEDGSNCQLLYRDNNITFNGIKSENTEFSFGFYTDHAELRYIPDPDNPEKIIIDGDNNKGKQKEWLFSIYLNIFLESVKDLPKEDYVKLYTQMRQQLIEAYGPPNNFDQIRWGYDGKNYKQYGAFNAGENTQAITYDDLKQDKVHLRVGWVINSRDIMLSLWQRGKSNDIILSFSAMSAPDSPNNKKTKPM